MAKTSKKVLARKRRQYKVRKKVLGTAERPRLTVFRSSRHIYAQLINDDFEQFNLDNPPVEGSHPRIGAITIFGISFKDLGMSYGGNIDAAKQVGVKIVEIAKQHNIGSVVFYCNGFLYYGCIKALADVVREAGLMK
jgi:large subunit ribosomal protein L18